MAKTKPKAGRKALTCDLCWRPIKGKVVRIHGMPYHPKCAKSADIMPL